jgi:hypothetical protein
MMGVPLEVDLGQNPTFTQKRVPDLVVNKWVTVLYYHTQRKKKIVILQEYHQIYVHGR